MNEDRVRRTVKELTVDVLGRPQVTSAEAYREHQERKDRFEERIWDVIDDYSGEDEA
jgi:hypothetical protein